MLYLNDSLKEELIQESLGAFPDECCGFLLGTEKRDERVIEEILVVNNAKEGDRRRRFLIAPLDYLRAERYAEQRNLTLLGIYHSHPNHPSVPSEHDRVAAQPYFSYVIISILGNVMSSIQSWRLNDYAQFEEEKIIHIKRLTSKMNNYGNNYYSYTA